MEDKSSTPEAVSGKVAKLYADFQVIKAYRAKGFITEKAFGAIEQDIKKQILESCGLELLGPNEYIFTKLN